MSKKEAVDVDSIESDQVPAELTKLPVLSRFSEEQMRELWNVGTVRYHPSNETIYLKRDQTFIVINGLLKLRNHAGVIANPNLCWLMYPGDYINFEIHKEI